jgi:hypothetical protein
VSQDPQKLQIMGHKCDHMYQSQKKEEGMAMAIDLRAYAIMQLPAAPVK